MASLSEYFKVLFVDRSLLEPAFEAKRLSDFKKRMTNELGQPAFPTIPFDKVIGKETVEVKNYTYLAGNSLPTDMALLSSLAASFVDCVFLEIGSWRGETLSNVAPNSRLAMSLTLGKDDMKRFGMGERFIQSHGIFTKDLANVRIYYHDSQTFNFSELAERPNLIFVDGDHSYKAVRKDTENAFKCLRDNQSIIVWHDYGYNTEHVRHDVMAAIYDGTPKEYRKFLYHVSHTMCAIFTRQTFPTRQIVTPDLPTLAFDLSINVRNI